MLRAELPRYRCPTADLAVAGLVSDADDDDGDDDDEIDPASPASQLFDQATFALLGARYAGEPRELREAARGASERRVGHDVCD